MEHRRFYAALVGLTALCCGAAAAVNFAGMPAFESAQVLAVSAVSASASVGSASGAVSVPFASSAVDSAGAVSARGSSAAASSRASAASSAASATAASPVNVNTADAAALESLPGIGEVLAQRIIDYRTANGSFSSLEDLQKVSGIGEKKAAALEGLVTF